MDELLVKRADGSDLSLAGAIVEDFREGLRGELILAGDPGYDAARTVWNGMVNKHPALIARCSGVADVISSVNFAHLHGLLLSVRGGGHNVAGKALCDGGLVIDLSEMRSVRVNAANRVAIVEGGATLADLDHETQAFGLAAPVGVISKTGVGGLTLHGGYGRLARRFGLSIDNLRALEVVTSDGHLQRASAQENPDLFWALQGGGGDFGVVTAFEFQLHPVGPEVWFGLTMYPAEQAEAGLRLFRDQFASAPEELWGIAMLWSAPNEPPVPEDARGKPVFVFLSCYTGPTNQGGQVLLPFRELGKPLVDITSPMPYETVQKILDGYYPDGRCYYWKSTYLKELSDDAIKVLIDHAAKRPSPLSSVMTWALGGAVARVPPTATPFGMRAAPYMISIESNWEDPSQTDQNMTWARQLFDALKPHSAGASYLNFPGFYEEGDSMLKGAYGDNLERLREIKNKYDPDNLFHGPLDVRSTT